MGKIIINKLKVGNFDLIKKIKRIWYKSMKKITLLIIISALISLLATHSQALAEQTNGMTLVSPEEMGAYLVSQHQEEARRTQEEARRTQEEEIRMEHIKETNPEAYNQIMEQRAKQEEVRLVVEAHARGELPSAEARYQLAEWMHDDVIAQLDNVDDELERLHKRIAKLEQQKENPDDYLMQRVDEMLGLAQVEYDDFALPL
jgi:hypothetical protein